MKSLMSIALAFFPCRSVEAGLSDVAGNPGDCGCDTVCDLGHHIETGID